jgi:hypothetical protein
MKQAIGLMVLVIGALELGRALAGDGAILLIVYGAIALMALMIAATFLWLWFERATPLALGMAYSWAGAALFAGWWWVYTLSGGAPWAYLPQGSFLIQGLSLVGALLHFAVIHRSFGYHGVSFLWPVALALGLSTVVFLVV